MSLTFKADGTIILPEGSRLSLTMYDREGDTLIPKYNRYPCTWRESKCRMSPCGKRPIFQWYCWKFFKDLEVAHCEGCDARP